jgi:hypothetical protein
VNGQIYVDIQQMRIGRLNVPAAIIKRNNANLVTFMQNRSCPK